jgi:pimeloyl-ACP methyl ester carboxylesterase
MTEAQVEMTAQERGRERHEEPLRGEDARRRLLADMPVTERRLLLAGISTAVLDGGDGPPVVLLHGPMANATHWMGIIPRLGATHRVIVPDLPGHGASETRASWTPSMIPPSSAGPRSTKLSPESSRSRLRSANTSRRGTCG